LQRESPCCAQGGGGELRKNARPELAGASRHDHPACRTPGWGEEREKHPDVDETEIGAAEPRSRRDKSSAITIMLPCGDRMRRRTPPCRPSAPPSIFLLGALLQARTERHRCPATGTKEEATTPILDGKHSSSMPTVRSRNAIGRNPPARPKNPRTNEGRSTRTAD